MLKRTRTAGALAAVILSIATLMAADAAREKQLQQGKDLLERGDLEKAATLFIEVSRSADPEIAARGLFHLAYVQELQGRNGEARATYARVVNNFPRQREVAERAQARATALSAPARSTQPALRTVAVGEDAASDAFVSRDGRYISHPDWNTGDIAIRDLVTGKTERLLGKTDWSSPAGYAEATMLSPDNSNVVYVWEPDQNNSKSELRLIPNRPGARPTTLASSATYADIDIFGWSPDGRSVFVVLYGSESETTLARVTLADKSVTILKSLGRRMAQRGRPALSPDGKYMAYALLASPRERNPQGQWVATEPNQHIYVLPTDGSGREERIVSGSNVNESPVWTPDGRRLLFVSNRDGAFGLWSVPIQNGIRNGNESYVDVFTAGRIWPIGMGSDGTYYYLPDSGERARAPGIDVFVAEVDATTGRLRGTPQRVTDTNLDSNQMPSWSPDGTRVAFLRRRPDLDTAQSGSAPHWEVIIHSFSDQREQSYVDTYVAALPPLWSHDGTSVFIKRNYNGGQLFRWDLNSGEPRSVESMAHSMLPSGWDRAALSPDDHTLYLTVAESPSNTGVPTPTRKTKIVAFSLGDGTQRTIWNSPDPLCPLPAGTKGACLAVPAMAISPDGKAMALLLMRSDWQTARLTRIDMSNGQARELAQGAFANVVIWAPDGRMILVPRRTETGADLVRVPAEGGSPASIGLSIRQANQPFDVSLDGRIVFTDRTREADRRLLAYENLLSLIK
jgi:Tol biopolymer transport system component